MFAYRPTSTHCFDLVKAMTFGMIVGVIICASIGMPITWVAWLNVGIGIVLSLYIMLFVEERWQHAGRVTRLIRYCVFRPLRLIQFCWWIAKWIAYGARPLTYPDWEDNGIKFSRWETFEHFWIISRSMANYDCQHWFTMQECRDELKATNAEASQT